MKRLLISFFLPFFLPTVLSAFLIALSMPPDTAIPGLPEVAWLAQASEKTHLDLTFLAAAIAGGLVLQLVFGTLFLRKVIAPVPTVGKAALCALFACAGVSLVAAVAIAFFSKIGIEPSLVGALIFVGVPGVFGCLIAWRLMHPYPRWEEPEFPV